MDRGHGEIGDDSDISGFDKCSRAYERLVRATSRSLTLLINSTVHVQPEQWIRHVISEPNLLEIRLLADFYTLSAFSSARAALRSQSTVAALSSCAAGDGAIALRW